jgi:D-amino-acid dehydrogenase
VKVAVLGAGLAGVTTAWELARDGHEVVVLDREPEVASGASFANGGIVAASRPYPWPSPKMAAAFLRALRRNDQAVRIRWQNDPQFWLWGLQFLASCRSARYERIFEAKRRLVRYSQERLHGLVQETGIEYGRLANGVLYVYRREQELEQGWKRSAAMRGLGCTIQRLAAAEVAEREPGISRDAIAGALYAPGDEAGDSARFCRELAERCRAKGVIFYLGCELLGTSIVDQTMTEAITSKGRIRADAYVFALGAFDPKLREHLGTPPPIYPVKGFSATLPIARAEAAPRHAGMDESRLVAWCPMGDRLRVTGGAEFAGYARSHAPGDFERLYEAIDELFPGATDRARAHTWTCMRPMTPESTPRFGTGRFANLYFNAGQGHMGWAMAAGSARIVADLVSGRRPGIELEGLRVRR